MQNAKELFLKSLESNVGEQTIRWQGRSETVKHYEAELTGIFERLDSDELAEKFYDWCQVDGAKPSDYKNRMLELSPNIQFIAGIRFKGGDVTKPFVEIACRNFEVTIPLLDALKNIIRLQFAKFNPIAMRIYLPEGKDSASIVGGEVDQFFVAGSVDDTVVPVPLRQNLRLDNPEDLDFYELLSKEFNDYKANSPYGDELFLMARTEISDAQKKGVVRTLVDQDGVAGIIVSLPECIKGLSGHLIVEEFLFSRLRGKGLGAPFQRAFIEELKTENIGYLFGTISQFNKASLKVAIKSGRSIIGSWKLFSLGSDRDHSPKKH